jgi:hypothetical protein
MTTKKGKPTATQYLTDQRVDLRASGNDVRKGVNVLNTSDPKNPAPNPFVQNQPGGSQGAKPGTGGKQGTAKSDSK